MAANNWNQFKKLFSAHFKMMFRDKSVWFWSIFYPVLLLSVFIMIFGSSSDSFSAKLALVEPSSNAMSKSLQQELKEIDVFQFHSEHAVPRDEAEQWLKDRDVDAVVILPESAANARLELIMNKEKQNSSSSQAISSILNSLVMQSNMQGIAVGPSLELQTAYISAGSEQLEYTDFLLTGLIALSVAQAGMFGMIDLVEMRRNGLLKRLIMTPAKMGLFGLGGIVVRFILSGIQIVLLSLIGILVFGAHLNINITAFLTIFLVGTLSFAGIGFMIAAFSKSMESYFGMANLFSFIMMFISGIFFDVSALPEYIKPLAHVLPLTYFANGIRDGMVYGFGMINGAFWLNIGVLLLWGVVTVLIGAKFYKWKEAK
ncbi:Linearmycin resistance permease protein LnrN [Paenibacillus plantiphilus]|uniref:Linearmycin resistance permease protein LnrN n=1 Tax=Paenibacillus plantiphilus TaxID=2905650 RepID=A0ABN8H7P5_9BACL|nr:ABC transporter permease [Paenibacillus plantiphilus]CAH1226297.1 Linearmycin resistance permease protein LnrN [Paenibacillus plantiphilus]